MSRKDDEELLELLHAAARATSDERPSPEVEARLLAEFARVGPGLVRAAQSSSRRPASASAFSGWWRQRQGWLAVAATLVVLAGASAWQWRHASPRPADLAAGRAVLRGARVVGPMTDVRPAVGKPGWAATLASPASAARGGRGERTPATSAGVQFVAWPGAEALPPFESGELIRTELPASVIPLLGLRADAGGSRTTVPADVVVGQDGQPRAVRLLR